MPLRRTRRRPAPARSPAGDAGRSLRLRGQSRADQVVPFRPRNARRDEGVGASERQDPNDMPAGDPARPRDASQLRGCGSDIDARPRSAAIAFTIPISTTRAAQRGATTAIDRVRTPTTSCIYLELQERCAAHRQLREPLAPRCATFELRPGAERPPGPVRFAAASSPVRAAIGLSPAFEQHDAWEIRRIERVSHVVRIGTTARDE